MKIKEPDSELEKLTLSEQKLEKMKETPLFLYLGDDDHYFNTQVSELTYDILKQAYIDKENGKVNENFEYHLEEDHTHSISSKELNIL